MSYVILNDVKSTTIKGLLISSLPPITKPMMRTSVEEIDGRDGDIVTNLGYSAYDKSMTIGLFGDFDIDEVIQYFDSEGTVIFSNEPDKYYKYQIIGQIDFERLVRFRTATVKFHCQPFKYSAVDNDFSFSINEMSVKPYTVSRNGVHISVQGGVFTFSGQATRATEIYIPIDEMALASGDYTLRAVTTGTGESACQLRVIGDVPTDADSFGGTYLTLAEGGEANLSATLSEAKTFNYAWFSVTAGTALDFTLDLQMLNEDLSSCDVINRGNIYSRPVITLYGSGQINLSINGVLLYEIALGDAGYITLDGIKMDAYRGNDLMNRSVAGDYENLKLKVGRNTISWDGDVTKIEIASASRWI